jgi:recombination protein RecT
MANNVYEIVEAQETQFCSVLATDSLIWEKEKQFAIQVLQNNKMLNDAAWKNKDSLANAVINVASIGISLNPAKKHAYLVPRKVGGKMGVCLDISYMGLLSIAMQTGAIEWGQAKIVYANDEYLNTGVDTKPVHKQKTFGDKGPMVGVYCTVRKSTGAYLTEEMDLEAIDKIKGSSTGLNSTFSPWKNWPEEMMRKAVVKRASKYWGDSGRLGEATSNLDSFEGGYEVPEAKDVTPTESDSLNGLLAGEALSIEDAILSAVSNDELQTAGARIGGMGSGEEKERLKTLWFQMKEDLSK